MIRQNYRKYDNDVHCSKLNKFAHNKVQKEKTQVGKNAVIIDLRSGCCEGQDQTHV